MACNSSLTLPRTNPCDGQQGGILFVEFCDFNTLGAVTYSVTPGEEDVITAFSGSPSWIKYDLNSTANNFVETQNTDADAGTTFYSSVLTLSLKQLDAQTQKELKLMAWGRPHIKITTRNGEIYIMGLNEGCKLGGATASSGGAIGEFTGYGLTLTSNEATPMNEYQEA